MSAMLLAAAVMSAGLPADAQMWTLCTQTEVHLRGREEPEASLVVAEAILNCAKWEPAVRRWLVRSVSDETGDAAYAERGGDVMLLSLKINAIPDLLDRARRAYSATRRQ